MAHPHLVLVVGRQATRRRVTPDLRLVPTPMHDAIRALRLRRTALATLEDHVRTLLGTNPTFDDRPARQRQTVAWIRSRSRQRPLSFENVCRTLQLDTPALRQRLLRVAHRLGVDD